MLWFATNDAYPSLTVDDGLAVSALRAIGRDARPLPWGGFPLGLERGDVVVVRSCWDYHLAPARFGAWLQALADAGVVIANGVDALRWNMHKRYLLELQQEHGVPIPPSHLAGRGQTLRLADIMQRLGTTQVVAKPAISLSAYETCLYHGSSATAEAAFAMQASRQDMIVQAYLPEITQGEHSLVFFGNVFSHAVLKTPAAGDFRVQQDHGGTHCPVRPSPELVRQAARVLDATGGSFAYARVDGVLVDGTFVLMELELIDPVLFLGSGGPAAVGRFVDALIAEPTQREVRRRGLRT